MYVLLGIAPATMAFYKSLLYLPWIIKPLWSPIVDVIGTQRQWVLGTQWAITVGLLAVALTLTTEHFFYPSLLLLLFLAFASATHDIAADGYYLSNLSEKQQAWFVGIRSTAYRIAALTVGAGMLALAGQLGESFEKRSAWAITFASAAAVFGVTAMYHAVVMPRQKTERRVESVSRLWAEVLETVTSFFRKEGMRTALAYLLFYRFAEAQLTVFLKPFMFADLADGGLAFSEKEVSLIYGVFGPLFLTAGGILGGIAIARHGLRRWMMPMAVAINVPNAVYVPLAMSQSQDLWLSGLAVSIESFGYGFGFAAYLMYMIYLARGEHETAHYAICTGVMAAGMSFPGIVASGVQQYLSYDAFFVYVLLTCLVSFAVTHLAARRLPVEA